VTKRTGGRRHHGCPQIRGGKKNLKRNLKKREPLAAEGDEETLSAQTHRRRTRVNVSWPKGLQRRERSDGWGGRIENRGGGVYVSGQISGTTDLPSALHDRTGRETPMKGEEENRRWGGLGKRGR